MKFHIPSKNYHSNFCSSNQISLVEGNGDDVEAGGFGGGMAAVMMAVGNPDDAAQENSGKGVEPCICHVQFGRACNPTMGLFFLSLSCI